MQLDSLPRPTKFALLVTGLFFFFGLHNFLQERIMHFEGFEYGMFLGFLEVRFPFSLSFWCNQPTKSTLACSSRSLPSPRTAHTNHTHIFNQTRCWA